MHENRLLPWTPPNPQLHGWRFARLVCFTLLCFLEQTNSRWSWELGASICSQMIGQDGRFPRLPFPLFQWNNWHWRYPKFPFSNPEAQTDLYPVDAIFATDIMNKEMSWWLNESSESILRYKLCLVALASFSALRFWGNSRCGFWLKLHRLWRLLQP